MVIKVPEQLTINISQIHACNVYTSISKNNILSKTFIKQICITYAHVNSNTKI